MAERQQHALEAVREVAQLHVLAPFAGTATAGDVDRELHPAARQEGLVQRGVAAEVLLDGGLVDRRHRRRRRRGVAQAVQARLQVRQRAGLGQETRHAQRLELLAHRRIQAGAEHRQPRLAAQFGPLLERLQQVQPVTAGQHQVADDEVETLRRERQQRLVDRDAGLQAHLVVLQRHRDEALQRGVVLHEEDPDAGCHAQPANCG